MLSFTVFAAILALCSPLPQFPFPAAVNTQPTANFQRSSNPDGSSNYGFQTVDGQSRSETIGLDGSVRGSYSYVDATGKQVKVNYIADKHGFRTDNAPGATASVHQAPAQAQQQHAFVGLGFPQQPAGFHSFPAPAPAHVPAPAPAQHHQLFPAGIVPSPFQQAAVFPQHQQQPQHLLNTHHQQDLEGQRKIAEAERAQQQQALQHERANQAIQQQQQQQLSALARQQGLPVQPQVHSAPAHQQPFSFPFHSQQPLFTLG